MIKNVAVIDDRGNRYEATYPKRAKGLVKNGRARFVDENTICLACPPDKSEDIRMSENMGLEILNSIKEQFGDKISAGSDAIGQEHGEGQGRQQKNGMSREIVERILEQIAHFPSDDSYIVELKENEFDDDDVVVNIVQCREITRQKQLELYKAILEKALENEANAQTNAVKHLEQLTDWMSTLSRDGFDADMWDMIKTKAFEVMDGIAAAVTAGAVFAGS